MVYVIYGSPCSGKSTYVKEHMQTGDIVCDLDRIFASVNFNEEHDCELYAMEVALKLYKTLLDIIKNREGEWKNAYVISIAKTSKELQEIVDRVNADEVIYIDTPFEICMERAKERPFYFPWIIEEWFEKMDLGKEIVIEK